MSFNFLGIPVRRAVSLQESLAASSGRTLSSIIRFIQGKITFITPGAYADYIQPRLRNAVSDQEVWANICSQVQGQLDRGIAEADITLG